MCFLFYRKNTIMKNVVFSLREKYHTDFLASPITEKEER